MRAAFPSVGDGGGGRQAAGSGGGGGGGARTNFCKSPPHFVPFVLKHILYSPPAVLWKATLPAVSATLRGTAGCPLGSSTSTNTAMSVAPGVPQGLKSGLEYVARKSVCPGISSMKQPEDKGGRGWVSAAFVALAQRRARKGQRRNKGPTHAAGPA